MARAVTFTVGREVLASPRRLWEVLGDFGAEHRWASNIAACRRDTEHVGVGTVRACILTKPLMGRASVAEEIIDYAPGRTLAYRLHGGAGPFRSAEGRWTIRAGSTTRSADRETTYVEVSGRLVPRGPLTGLLLSGPARAIARRAARASLADLAAYVERQSS